MARVRVSRAFVVLSVAMLVAGGAILSPWAYLLWRFEDVVAEDVDVYRLPLGEGRVEIAVAFTYAVDGTLLGEPAAVYQVLGCDRCDRLGRILPPLILSDADAGDLVQRVRGQGRAWLAWYDPSQPLTSGRVQLGPSGDTFHLVDGIGISLFLTPVFVWLVILLIQVGAWGMNRSQRRPL